MTDKELKKMSRGDLLEMLISQMEENEKLRTRLRKAEKELKSRRIKISKAGSIAEAALELNEVFRAAEEAAAQYLENVRLYSEKYEELEGLAETPERAKTEKETPERAKTEKETPERPKTEKETPERAKTEKETPGRIKPERPKPEKSKKESTKKESVKKETAKAEKSGKTDSQKTRKAKNDKAYKTVEENWDDLDDDLMDFDFPD